MDLFNETIMNILSNFISNKIKTFRDSDPPWINDDIKNKIKLKHKLHHRYQRHKRDNEDFAKLEHLRNEIDNLISKSKKEYYQNINRKLNDPLTSSKHCVKIVQIWSYFWSVFSCIRTGNNSVFGHFSRSENLLINNESFFQW